MRVSEKRKRAIGGSATTVLWIFVAAIFATSFVRHFAVGRRPETRPDGPIRGYGRPSQVGRALRDANTNGKREERLRDLWPYLPHVSRRSIPPCRRSISGQCSSRSPALAWPWGSQCSPAR